MSESTSHHSDSRSGRRDDPFSLARNKVRPGRRYAQRDHGERWDVLTVIAIGGALGALIRYGVGLAIAHKPGEFAWSTFVINVTGCLIMGCFMVIITEAFVAHRLLRPFFGVGVLGGYTTFSSYVVDAIQQIVAGDYRAALFYSVGTVVATLIAMIVGVFGTRELVAFINRKGSHSGEQNGGR